jgi:hypothetical protein
MTWLQEEEKKATASSRGRRMGFVGMAASKGDAVLFAGQ